MSDGSATVPADMSSGGPATGSRPGSDAGRRVPDVVAPPPRHPRFPLVDGMRAIAVLAVVGVHTAVAGEALSSSVGGRLLAHLNIGVTIFFLISGFLLYRPFVAGRKGELAAPTTPDYAKRRFLRIYPAYWVIVTVLVVVPGLTAVLDGHWLPMYSLLHTLPVYDGRGCVQAPFDCGLAQTWSLVVEVTFYAALPLYALAMAWLGRRITGRRALYFEVLLLAVLSACSVLLQFVVLEPVPRWLANSALGYVFWFALGMGMAIFSVQFSEGARRPRLIRTLGARPEASWILALAIYAIVCAWLPSNPFLFKRSEVLVAHVAFGFIAALVLAPAVFEDHAGGLPRRLLARPAMAWLGLISYGIFLWHYVVTLQLGREGAGASFVVVLIGTLAISIACAAASYYWIERPLLRLKYVRIRDLLRRRT